MTAQEVPRFTLGNRAHELVDHRAPLENLHVWNAADTETLRDLRILFRVDLGQEKITLEFLGQSFQHRPENPAGTAPRRPEIYNHRAAKRLINYRLVKVLNSYILYVNRCCHELSSRPQIRIFPPSTQDQTSDFRPQTPTRR